MTITRAAGYALAYAPYADNVLPPPDRGTITRAEITRAVPTGSRRVRGQREALHDGLSCADLAGVRADFRRHLEDWWRAHVLHASWGGPGREPCGITRPTRARVCQRTGMSVSTHKACRRWWEARGYIAIVRPGRTPDLRPCVLADPDSPNDAQVYVLCIPRRSRPRCPAASPTNLTRPLSESHRDSDRYPAREDGAEEKPEAAKRGCPRSPVLARGPLRRLTDGWWAHLTAPFAGWTAADLVYAVDHEPDGRPHRYRLADVRHPAGWLRWRLSRWLGPDGALPSPSERRRPADAARRAEQAARRAELAAAKAAASPNAATWTTKIRRQMAEASPAARAEMERLRAARAREERRQALFAEARAAEAERVRQRVARVPSRRPRSVAPPEPVAPTRPPLPKEWTDAVAAAAAAVAAEESGGAG